MSDDILYLPGQYLSRHIRNTLVANDFPNLYWSDDWSLQYYWKQAYLGFIATAWYVENNPILLPELQESYAVLYHECLKEDRNVRRIRTRTPREGQSYCLKVDSNLEVILNHLHSIRPNSSWLIPEYQKLISDLAHDQGRTLPISFWATSLETPQGTAAGELGYTIGKTYTSLSGFHYREKPEWNHFGKLQMVLLSEHLNQRGIEFWNLGHPQYKYKRDLGAQVISRKDFLSLWDKEVEKPAPSLTKEITGELSPEKQPTT